jgi:hypothetical protein
MIKITVQLTDDRRVSDYLAALAMRKLHYVKLKRSGIDGIQLDSARRKYEVAVNEAILHTYGLSNEFDLVTCLLDGHEIAEFIWEAATHRKPVVAQAS